MSETPASVFIVIVKCCEVLVSREIRDFGDF